MHKIVERHLNQNISITYDRPISFSYNILYIYNVLVGHITYTKPWDRLKKITKLGAEFLKFRDLCSAMSRMVIVLFDFSMVGEVPQTPRYSPQNLEYFLKL